jgi:putative Mn2+ efflux pump MntP
MDFLTIVLMAVGLAMDAMAVSIARGITIEHKRRKACLILAMSFGVFQMFMPVIGFFAGLSFKDLIMGI